MDDVNRVAKYCYKNLALENAELSEEFYYQSMPLCIIDSVFSIGVNYSAVENVIERYCKYFNLERVRAEKAKIPKKAEQQSVSEYLELVDKYGIEYFTENIFDNRQRTSPVNGILKSRATYKFAKVLKKFNIDYFQDVNKIICNCEFKKEIKKIPGQKSGISLNYFFMLVGYDDYIKPDRMVLRFLEKILGKKLSFEESQTLLVEVSQILKEEHSNLTPKLLDYQIWNYERENNS